MQHLVKVRAFEHQELAVRRGPDGRRAVISEDETHLAEVLTWPDGAGHSRHVLGENLQNNGKAKANEKKLAL